MRSSLTTAPETVELDVAELDFTSRISPRKSTTVASLRTVEASTCTVACSSTVFTRCLSSVPLVGNVEEAGVWAKVTVEKRPAKKIAKETVSILCMLS